MTLTFLVAYLFYNDGIQTVIYSAAVYGSDELKFGQSVLIGTILLIQFVAFGGALFFGRLAGRYGAYRAILWGTFAWMAIVVSAMFLPVKNLPLFLAVGVAIGVVLGGTQALSRSFFSLLIPRGREGEYFALYNACERGTSWFGVLLFGVVFQVTGSYRPAIVSLIIFFVLGVIFLLRLDPNAVSPRPGTPYRPRSRPQLSAGTTRPLGRRPWSITSAKLNLARREEYGNLRGLGTVNSQTAICQRGPLRTFDRFGPSLMLYGEHTISLEVPSWRSARYAGRGWEARVSRTSAASSSPRASRSVIAVRRATFSRSPCPSRRTSRQSGSALGAARRARARPASSVR